jgi:hypothetical protein
MAQQRCGNGDIVARQHLDQALRRLRDPCQALGYLLAHDLAGFRGERHHQAFLPRPFIGSLTVAIEHKQIGKHTQNGIAALAALDTGATAGRV